MTFNEKKISNEATSFKKKLLTYSAAAGAALTMASPANAAIHYSGPKDISVNNSNQFQSIDLNGDYSPNFVFVDWDITTNSGIQGVMIAGSSGAVYNSINKFLGAHSEGHFEPCRLTKGDIVSADAQGSWKGTSNGFLNIQTCVAGSWRPFGNFIDQGGYIGVRFGDKYSNTRYYGWIAYEGTGYSGGKISGWAYEDVPNKAIVVGDTGAKPPIPTLNQWGIIFLMGLILLEGARRIKRSRDEE